MIHTIKGFGIVNKAEIDVFLELSCFFHDRVDVGNLISVSSAFSKTSLNIRKFTVHVYSLEKTLMLGGIGGRRRRRRQRMRWQDGITDSMDVTLE